MSVGNRLTGGLTARVSKRRNRQQRESEDRLAERFAQQWSSMRAERRAEQPAQPIATGPSNYAPARVPFGMDLAAAWTWRLLLIAAGIYVLGRLMSMFLVVVLPVVIALLLTALVAPIVKLLTRLRLPRGLASLAVVIGIIAVVALMVTFASRQIAQGANNLSDQVVAGLSQVEDWLKTGPLHASDSQINGYLNQAKDAVSSSNTEIVGKLTEVGTTLADFLAGFFIIVFSTYFFLADGARIWSWVVRIFPRAARSRADSSGRIAWTSLTAFIRATVIVAFTDAVFIMIGAAVLQVPFVIAIGVLVFLGAFIPLIGAFLSGFVAVLVALVDRGPVVALVMLGVIVLIQQIEAHVLQPFLLGRLVSVHPLGVIVAIAAGVIVGGIPGALVAVPFVASASAVVAHLSDTSRTEREAQESTLGDSPPA